LFFCLGWGWLFFFFGFWFGLLVGGGFFFWGGGLWGLRFFFFCCVCVVWGVVGFFFVFFFFFGFFSFLGGCGLLGFFFFFFVQHLTFLYFFCPAPWFPFLLRERSEHDVITPAFAFYALGSHVRVDPVFPRPSSGLAGEFPSLFPCSIPRCVRSWSVGLPSVKFSRSQSGVSHVNIPPGPFFLHPPPPPTHTAQPNPTTPTPHQTTPTPHPPPPPPTPHPPARPSPFEKSLSLPPHPLPP